MDVFALLVGRKYKCFLLLLKFIYSEKAAKFCEIFPLILTACTVVKIKGKILQNFVAFSEYMNFKCNRKDTKNNFSKIFGNQILNFTPPGTPWTPSTKVLVCKLCFSYQVYQNSIQRGVKQNQCLCYRGSTILDLV